MMMRFPVTCLLAVVVAVALVACAGEDALTPAPSPTATTAAPTVPPADTPTPRPTLTPTPQGSTLWAGPIDITGQLRLASYLDDPQGYCIDVPGFFDSIRLDAPLQAHTCKPREYDQTYKFYLPQAQYSDRARTQIILTARDRCLSVDSVSADGELNLMAALCDNSSQASTRQDFFTTSDGKLLTAIGGRLPRRAPYLYCIGVAEGPGEPAGGRNHLRRDLVLYYCDDADPALITWELAIP